jgi:hypothetical protein
MQRFFPSPVPLFATVAYLYLSVQEPDIAVAVGKDGYLKVFDLDQGRELTNQRVPKPMARTNTCILDFFGTTRLQISGFFDFSTVL